MSLSPFLLVSCSFILLAFLLLLTPFLRSNQKLLIVSGSFLMTVASLATVAAGVWTVSDDMVSRVVLPLGLPDLPFHIRLDPLSGFFLVVIGLLSSFVSLYSLGYLKGYLGLRPVTSLVVFSALFLAGMFLVVLADDAFFFLIAWEMMAASSYYLVLFEDERVENRRAAFLYLVVAHVGAIAILLSFGVMAGLATGFTGFQSYTFDAMRETDLPAGLASVAFLLAFFGFSAKAGVIPLHVWLPEAHPVAPSNVSALMSGVMLKTAIYGIVRVAFDLIGDFPWWWGAMVLVFGLVSAVLGVLYALMQHDLKRLLAYHSVENIGIILIGIGLAMIFTSFDLPLLAALALIAGLYHTLNHALFKGLLFMGAGAVLHATHERNMEEMGGLIRFMPWTAVFFLVGCISISALPPFNGFVSEWLTYQAFLLSPGLPNPLLNLLIPLGAALLALTSALAAACFVKAFGVTFLGHRRGHHHGIVREAGWSMRIGMMLASISCLALGVLPTVVIQWMDPLAEMLVGGTIAASASGFGWMWLTPIAAERASYSAPVAFIGILSVVVVTYLLLHARPGALHRVPLWDCGFERITSRMQYTATSFAMPIRRIFGFIFSIKEQAGQLPPAAHPAFPQRLYYHLRVRDRFWMWMYQPVVDASFWLSRRIGRMQHGRIQIYLIYSFVTILVLLIFL
ncbi:MAG: hydrogenase 4 subunit B [Nitrospirae bacterium]|nr:hydrogenase 4 subunit B [Nitrospirota bacterium]NTW64832.1 hydrogenase 4 subunit B [Nitrospirota bacterium]